MDDSSKQTLQQIKEEGSDVRHLRGMDIPIQSVIIQLVKSCNCYINLQIKNVVPCLRLL